MINYCPSHVSNWSSYRCIGDTIVWTQSHSFALKATLLVSPLIFLVAWLVFGRKNTSIMQSENNTQEEETKHLAD